MREFVSRHDVVVQRHAIVSALLERSAVGERHLDAIRLAVLRVERVGHARDEQVDGVATLVVTMRHADQVAHLRRRQLHHVHLVAEGIHLVDHLGRHVARLKRPDAYAAGVLEGEIGTVHGRFGIRHEVAQPFLTLDPRRDTADHFVQRRLVVELLDGGLHGRVLRLHAGHGDQPIAPRNDFPSAQRQLRTPDILQVFARLGDEYAVDHYARVEARMRMPAHDQVQLRHPLGELLILLHAHVIEGEEDVATLPHIAQLGELLDRFGERQAGEAPRVRRRDEPPADGLHLYAGNDADAQTPDPDHRRRLRLANLGALADVHVRAEEGEPGLTDAFGENALAIVKLVVSDGRCAVSDAVH